MRTVALGSVRLADGPFARSQHLDLDYVLSLDPDRLLAPLRREAGQPTPTESYGNWENSGLDGHTAGHVLSALAFLTAATGDARAEERLTAMVAEIGRCQDAIGTGYVGGVPGGVALFESAREGVIPQTFGSSDVWVPWYNVHKLVAGLIDAHREAGTDQALRIAERFGEWWLSVSASIDDEGFETMLATEYGGMNETFAQLAELTGRADFAREARRFSHRALLEPTLAGADVLTGLHANTQIPKVVGWARTADVEGDDQLRAAARGFWTNVVRRRSVANGGNSVREHFHPVEDFGTMVEDREGPEFCNSYNMLKLARLLWQDDPRSEYLDCAERILYNHVLASQHPDHGGFVYFTPMRPRHYRVYSQSQHAFWCCVGTGMESHATHGELVFATGDDVVAVNLFIPAVLDDELFGRLAIDTAFPEDERVVVRLEGARAGRWTLRLRVPGWASGGLRDLTVDGVAATTTAVDGAVLIERDWRGDETVAFRVPLEVHAERLPDGSDWVAWFAGPVLLAARAGHESLDGLVADDSRMGHVARGPLLPLAGAPIVESGDSAGELAAAAQQTGEPLRFRLAVQTPAGEEHVELEPFFGLHDERYIVYFPWAPRGAAAARRAQLAGQDLHSLALDAVTVDHVAMGEQQPESDHAYRGVDTAVGSDGGRHWRATRSTMAVTLRDPDAAGRKVRIGWRGLGVPTGVQLVVDGRVVAEESSALGEGEWRESEHALVGEFTDDRPAALDIEFRAIGGRSTPGVGVVRLVR